MGSLRRVYRTLAITLVLNACASPRLTAPVPQVAMALDTVISRESRVLKGVSDLAVAPSGRLYIADQAASAVRFVDPDGSVGAFEGHGRVRSALVDVATVRSYEAGFVAAGWRMNLVQRFSSDGTVLEARPWKGADVGAVPYLLGPASYLIATAGWEGTLVMRVGGRHGWADKYGELLVPFDFDPNPTRMRQQVADGEIPGMFRNVVLTAGSPEGDVWMALPTDGEVRRYASDGSLVWSTPLDEPEMAGAWARAVRRNQALGPGSVSIPFHFVDLDVVDDRAWVLLDTRERDAAALVVLGPDGQVQARFKIPGAGSATHFAFEPRSRSLYLSTQEGRAVVKAMLPPLR